MPTTLIIVDNPKSWPLELTGVEIVPARQYLTDPAYTNLKHTKVFNLCRSYRYQAVGYYVSLLAEARGHKPIPRLSTIQDMKLQTIVRFVSDDLDDLIQKSLGAIQSDRFTLSIYFGRNMAKRY
ncbi:MAG: RimK-like ATPgrasp N-terminal domain-containing protein, partial [Thermodesulfobacteriota bacterium]